MGKLIDADVLREEVYLWGMNDYEPSDFTDAIDDAPPVEAIPIPKGATNGDMMIAIYGIVDAEVNERSVRLFPKDGGQLWVTKDWWNAEFKEPIKALEQEPTTKNNLGVDAISRADALALYCDKCGVYNCISKCSSYRAVEKMPPVTPQEPRKGHWILDETDNSITCDKCGCLIWANDISNGEAYFCPNCGAKMVEPQESEG